MSKRGVTKQKVSYKEESDDVTDSEDLIEMEVTEADQEKELAETIEKVIRHRTGLKGGEWADCWKGDFSSAVFFIIADFHHHASAFIASLIICIVPATS